MIFMLFAKCCLLLNMKRLNVVGQIVMSLAGALGIAVGCMLGMFPLAFKVVHSTRIARACKVAHIAADVQFQMDSSGRMWSCCTHQLDQSCRSLIRVGSG